MTEKNVLRVLGMAGSLRAGSYNQMLLRAAIELVPPGMQIEIYEGLREIPPYDQDVEAKGVPPPVARLKEAVAQSDALLIATAEYNYSVPGFLKNAIDWVSRPPRETPLIGKPTAVMGASTGPGGTARAQTSLRTSFIFTQTPVMPGPEILVSFATEKFDPEGRLTDPKVRESLKAFLGRLEVWTRRFVS